MQKVIALVDCDCFFVSCERVDNPSLNKKPVCVVTSTSNKGIVISRSSEAKALGIKMGAPLFQIKADYPDVFFIKSRHKRYEEISKQVMQVLQDFSPLVEEMSIDEAYIDMTDVYLTDNPRQYFIDLQKEIYEKLHIPCSIGVSYCRFLAKMGSDYKKPLGITIIKKKDVPSIIWPLKIQDCYGIGKASSAKLIELGIKTIGDFVNSNDYRVREVLGSYYETALAQCKGEVAERITLKFEPPKSIGNSHTLEHNTDDYQIIKENLKYLCDEVSRRLKVERMLGYTITLTIKDKNFVSKSK